MGSGNGIPDGNIRVEGSLPKALSGRYLCIEPNLAGGPRVHSLSIHDGTAGSYRRRLVLTRAPNGAATTNLIEFGGRVIALADGAIAQDLSPSLATTPVDVAGRHLGVGADPKTDPSTGELHLISTPGEATAQHHVLSSGGMTRRTHPIEGAPMPVLDLAITRDHLVLLADGFLGLTDRGHQRPILWLPSAPMGPGRVVAAKDHDGHVVMHVVDVGLEEWTASPTTATVHRRILDATRQQPSCVNEQASGFAHRYLYGVGSDSGTPPACDSTLFKHDLATGARQDRTFGKDHQAGAFLFVVDPARRAREDGGWLLGLVHDYGTERSRLVVLDAADLAGPILASADLTRPVTHAQRGLWSPSHPLPSPPATHLR